MAKRGVKVNVEKKNPDRFLTLCQEVIEMHNELGPASPFAAGDFIDMTAFTNRTTQAVQLRNEASECYAQARAAMGASNQLIGNRRGQTVNTPETLYTDIVNIKKILMVLNQQNPEALSLWGFDVVVRMGKNPKKRKKRA